MDYRSTVKPAAKRGFNRRGTGNDRAAAAKPAMKLPTIEHSSKVVRSMQSGLSNARQPSRSVRQPDHNAKPKTPHSTQPAGARAASSPTAVNWQPPKQLPRLDELKNGSSRGRKGPAPLLDVDCVWRSFMVRQESITLGGTQREQPQAPPQEKRKREKRQAVIPLDLDHRLANAKIDALDAKLGPTLRRFGIGLREAEG
jgi:hypothetical protein